MDYTGTLAALLGWVGRTVRVSALAGESADPIVVLNGVLGRGPDAGDGDGGESLFFCVGHDDPRDGRDGFFLPAAPFTGAAFTVPPEGRDPESVLVIGLGSYSLVIEVDPVLGIPSL